MKKFMYLSMMLLAALFTFTACGSDDDDEPDNGGGGQGGSTITANQILGTWYGIDENNADKINIFVMTFKDNGKGTYSEYKAKAKNNWEPQREFSANMAWTLNNNIVDLTITIDGEAITRKGELMKLNGNTLTIKRYFDDGDTDVMTLTRVSGEQEVATLINNMANEKKQNNQSGDDNYSYSETVDVQGLGEVTIIGEATFTNGKVNAMTISYVYASKSIAKQMWDAYQENPEDENWEQELKQYSYDGDRTITYRFSEEAIKSYAVANKLTVCETLKTLVHKTARGLQGIS